MICFTGWFRERKIGDGEVVPLGTRGASGELSWDLPAGWDVCDVVVHGFAMNSKGNRASVSVGLAVGDEV